VNWTDAALGATYALPGALVTLSDPVKGLALTVGVLPPAIMGLAPTRRGVCAPSPWASLFFSLPMVGVGLSYSAGKAATVGALMIVGAVFACVVSMLWAEHPAGPRATPTAPSAAEPTLGYGIRLGAAGRAPQRSGFSWTSSMSVGPAPPRCS
jgi:hypothetical protein